MAANCFFFFFSCAYFLCSICSSSVSDVGKCRNTMAPTANCLQYEIGIK